MPYGQIATIGALANVGSRNETDDNTGVNHMLELLAFQSTPQYSATEIIEKMDTLGGFTFANSSREQMMYCIDILQSNIDDACEILAGTVLSPNFTEDEVEGSKQIVHFLYEDMMPEMKVLEGLQRCAYMNQPLGRPHLCKL